jgi:hypothetical protein
MPNRLTFNLDKTNVIHCKSNHLQDGTFQIKCQGEDVKEAMHTKFHKLGLDDYVKWKTHIDLISPKRGRTCYGIRSMYFLRTLEIRIYCAILIHIVFNGLSDK